MKTVLKMTLLTCALVCLFFIEGLAAEHSGYLSSVAEERDTLSYEIVIVPLPPPEGLALRDQIFTEKLTKDFTDRYERRFGRTQGEQIQSVPSRFFEKDLGNGQFVSEEEYVEQQRKFGAYMSRKLLEYHIDQGLKKTKTGTKVFEAKEAVSNVSVDTKSGFSYKIRYNVAANDVDLKIVNPYNLDTRLTFDLGSSETSFLLGVPLSKRFRMAADYTTDQSKLTLSAIQQLKHRWSTSLTGSTSDLEDKIILGFSWSD